MNVLHIQSSPRGDKSNSIALTNAFLAASRKLLPEINEDFLNVWDENLPSPRHSSSIRGDLDFVRILQYHRRSIIKRLTLIFGFVS